ncbi:PHB depolymerase family esterase [Shinella daejeonensis]|uniref:extracellular catalytic domain type 1 short-chain-length polyhydroxyalkanoate depolymerase n=1 Tax=Shinella daejeonensis TaxID=659017 RepID=UPI0020C7E28C|nr:PHB depolymerase family esterase [Shinella daejeonensis]MCP8897532.1 PHB depolymerase family esterase [Shinella daejeonensis]
MRDRFKRSLERLLPAMPDIGVLSPSPAAGRRRAAASLRRKRTAPGRLTEIAEFGANPGNLRMLVHIPEGLPAGRPLVLVLHGCRQEAESYDRASGWSRLADERGFCVVYAEQKPVNNPARCFTWFRPSEVRRDRGELMSIRRMVAHAAGMAKTDRRRVFVTGLSAGGAMAAALLAVYPGDFAGGAIIAGLPFGAARDVPRALAAMREAPARSAREWGDLVRAASPRIVRKPVVSVWHGTADETVSLSNGHALVEQWRDRYGLPGEGFVEKRLKGRRTRIWPDGEGRALVILHEIDGMGHGTPVLPGEGGGHAASAEPFMLEAGFSSTLEIAKEWGLTRRWKR